MDTLTPSKGTIQDLERKLGDDIRKQFESEPQALAGPDAAYIAGFADADSRRAKTDSARREAIRLIRARRTQTQSDKGSGKVVTQPPVSLDDNPAAGGVSVSGGTMSGNAVRQAVETHGPEKSMVERMQAWARTAFLEPLVRVNRQYSTKGPEAEAALLAIVLGPSAKPVGPT